MCVIDDWLQNLSVWVGGLRLSVGGGSVWGMKYNKINSSNSDFAKWLIERWELMNVQLAELAVTFIGFLGVELGLIAQADPKDFDLFEGARLIGALAILSLVASILLFIKVIVSEKFHIPESSQLRDFHSKKSRGNTSMADYYLLETEIPAEDLFASLEVENRNLNKTYMPGIYVSALGQFLIGVLLIARWFVN